MKTCSPRNSFLFAALLAAVPLFGAAPDPAALKDPVQSLKKASDPWTLLESLLEGGRPDAAQEYRKTLKLPAQQDAASRVESLEKLFEGDYPAARAALEPVSARDPWTVARKSYLDGLLRASEGFVETPSDHFRFRAVPEDAFLAQYAVRALENAHSKMAEVFQLAPSTPVVAEVYPDEKRFSAASTLSEDALERSGAIGICKFRRLMVLSPRATPLGYRWLDAFAHEYNHSLVNRLSGARCPLWLHEGVARYYETAWRRAGPFEHAPAAETKLAEAALLEGTTAPALIPFARMEPSMVYLENQEQVALAFAQVSDAVAYLVEEFGAEKLADLLRAFRTKAREEAFDDVLGMSEEEFETSWRESLKERAWQVSKGAMSQQIRLGRVDEAELLGPDARGHVRLGDRLRQQDQPEAALLQYGKALELEPDNGVALLKAARARIASGDSSGGEELLRRAVKKNAAYVTPFVALGELLFEEGRYEEAQPVLEEALEINPFHPKIHEYLGLIALDIGHFPAARQSIELALRFDPSNEELRQVLRQMPRER